MPHAEEWFLKATETINVLMRKSKSINLSLFYLEARFDVPLFINVESKCYLVIESFITL